MTHDFRSGSLKKQLCWLVAASLGLSACGAGQPEGAKAPPPKKVQWDGSGGEPAAEEASAEGGDEEAAAPAAAAPAAVEEENIDEDPNAIDLDALAAEKAAPKPKPASKPKPAPPPRAAAPAPKVAEKAAQEPAEEKEEAEAPVAKAAPEPAPADLGTDPLALELRKRREAAKARAEARGETAKGKKSSSKKNDAAEAAEPAASAYKGSDPCRATSFSLDRVRDACANGGRAAAKRVMKDAIGKATATGQSLRCTNCHANQNDYTLKGDAVADLKRWLEGSGG